MKNILFFIIILFTYINTHAQQKDSAYNFSTQIRETKGDLNKDELIDKVTVFMDTVHETRPLRLQIFFGQPNGKFKSIVSSTKIIYAQYPTENNGKHHGHQIPYFPIKNGDLYMQTDIKGQSEHTFRYQNGNFELIRFYSVDYDGKNTTIETTFDLVSGKFLKQSQQLLSNEIFNKIEKKISVKPLPKIQNFIPFENEFY